VAADKDSADRLCSYVEESHAFVELFAEARR
jgi:hypothetical protein